FLPFPLSLLFFFPLSFLPPSFPFSPLLFFSLFPPFLLSSLLLSLFSPLPSSFSPPSLSPFPLLLFPFFFSSLLPPLLLSSSPF
ncbi:hypothetical protein ACXWRS_10975, partial [Streptococcus pyogenes]